MIIKEIQGIRSLAVILILFFHLGIPYFELGYLGVDIFFIISGFIFTKIILKSTKTKSFSIEQYLRRRVLRLFPALFVTLFLVTLLGWLFYTPLEFKYYGQSLFGSSLFMSNIYFYILQNDYFSPSNYSLLHLWSLSLEVQFYVLFPLLILLINKFKYFKKKRNLIFFFIFIISFYINVFLSNDEKFIFYFLPNRLWEFLMGYFIYIKFFENKNANLANNNFYLFFFLFVYALYLIFGESQFIKYQIYTAVIFLALFITSFNKENILNKFLSNQFNQNLAKYSYVLFLVHYPIIHFAKYFEFYEINFHKIFLILFTIIIFTLLIFQIEKKFYEIGKYKKNQNINYKYIFSILILFMSMGLYFHLSKGVKLRYFINKQIDTKYISKSNNFSASKLISGEDCNVICQKINSNDKSLLLFGDSHAGDFENILTTKLREKKIDLYLSYFDIRGKKYLQALDQLAYVLKNKKINYVFIVHHKISKDEIFKKKLTDILYKYPNTDFYYLLQRIEFNQSPIKYKILNKKNIDNKKIFPPVYEFVSKLNFHNFHVIDQNEILLSFGPLSCQDLNCFDGHDIHGYPLYRDNHHLTSYGSKLFINKLFKSLSLN